MEVNASRFIHMLMRTPEQRNILPTMPTINISVPKSFCFKIINMIKPTTNNVSAEP